MSNWMREGIWTFGFNPEKGKNETVARWNTDEIICRIPPKLFRSAAQQIGEINHLSSHQAGQAMCTKHIATTCSQSTSHLAVKFQKKEIPPKVLVILVM